MQKLINVLALASFAVSAAVVGGGTWLYLNKDVLVERAREKAAAAATEATVGRRQRVRQLREAGQ